MRALAEVMRARLLARAAVVVLGAAAAAGCSADVTRFASPTFSGGSRTSAAPHPQGDVTGSVRAAPAQRVETRPLTQSAPLPPPSSATPPQISRPPTAAPQTTASVQTPTRPAPAAQPGWTWDGGTPIIVGSGDTLASIAQRYGVPAAAIVQANGLPSGGALQPGQRLVIPRYNSTAAAAAQPARPAAGAAAPSRVTHVVAPGETLTRIAARYGRSITEIAQANKIPPYTKVNVGDRLVIPGAKPAIAARGTAPAVSPPAVQPPRQVAAQAPQPQPTARVVTPAKDQPSATDSVKTAEGSGALPTFRWPVRGRVITNFGPKPNGQQNDGINLAVPEGTPFRAADDGVVAYSGNELKGYGNLVLVRHANGYVTAYAHASELKVKRGDQVKRGQVLGLAGQTGNVTSPQLHFEIRKGALPVDPMQFLNGA